MSVASTPAIRRGTVALKIMSTSRPSRLDELLNTWRREMILARVKRPRFVVRLLHVDQQRHRLSGRNGTKWNRIRFTHDDGPQIDRNGLSRSDDVVCFFGV